MPQEENVPSDGLWISSLCCMIFYLNDALGKGKGKHITFADVYREIDRGTLFPFFEKEIGPQPVLSFLRPGTHKQADFFAVAMRKMEGYDGDEGKFLLSRYEHNGVCLAIALIAELIQQGEWDIASVSLPDPRG
jgi:hypothetical protein